MVNRRFLRSSVLSTAFVLASLAASARFGYAQSQTLIFQRAGTLSSTEAGTTGASAPVRSLFTIGSDPSTFWAVAPDGRRIAWLVRSGTPAKADDPNALPGLVARPATVYVSDMSGRHRKKLFSTDALHDRQGRPVTALGLGDTAGKLEDWEPVSLSWSADSRTLYFSCLSTTSEGVKATYAADAASGLTVVDSEDRWKSIAPAAFLDARGGLLVGAGAGRFNAATPLPSGSPPPIRYGPLLVVNLAAGTRTPLYAAPGGTTDAAVPDYAFALYPVLSPDEKTIAFAAPGKGLWVVDRKSREYHRLVDGIVQRPRWSADGKTVYFLLARPSSGDSPVNDIYAIDVPATFSPEAGPPPVRLVLQSVDWFDLTAE